MVVVDKLHAENISKLINDFLFNYERPVTILYLSDNPEVFTIRHNDVLVLWSNCQNLKTKLYGENYLFHILLEGCFNKDNLVSLAECEHFDMTIVDIEVSPNLLQNEAHLADHTFFITSKNIKSASKVGEIGSKNVFLMSKAKTVLPRNWWKSSSFHKNYHIVSTFNEKYLIKPGECSTDKKAKKYDWKPGINLFTFIHLNGSYPSINFIREKIIEIFSPLTHGDFGAANIILQGSVLKAIDYDDTIYSEDPYERLRKTLEKQLGIHYIIRKESS